MSDFRVDVAIIGAGVVGLAIAEALSESGKEVLILESEDNFGKITSSRNSGVIHAGIWHQAFFLRWHYPDQVRWGRRHLWPPSQPG